jgi:hypothetical protein
MSKANDSVNDRRGEEHATMLKYLTTIQSTTIECHTN